MRWKRLREEPETNLKNKSEEQIYNNKLKYFITCLSDSNVSDLPVFFRSKQSNFNILIGTVNDYTSK